MSFNISQILGIIPIFIKYKFPAYKLHSAEMESYNILPNKGTVVAGLQTFLSSHLYGNLQLSL